MTGENIPRPVSGEILAPPAVAGRTPQAIGAEFESVGTGGAAKQPRIADSTAAGMQSLGPGVDAARPLSRRGGPAFWAAGLCLVGVAFWTSGGHALLRTDEPAREPGLRVVAVDYAVEPAGGRPMLRVSGQTVNEAATALPLPALEIAVTAADGETLRYRLAGRAGSLAPGATSPFSGRLDLPRSGVSAVAVTVAR